MPAGRESIGGIISRRVRSESYEFDHSIQLRACRVGATPSLLEFDSVSWLLDRSGRCAQEMAATACSRIKQASAERVPVCCVHTVQDANSIAGSSTSPTVFHGFMLDTWKNLSTCVATAREVHNDMYVSTHDWNKLMATSSSSSCLG